MSGFIEIPQRKTPMSRSYSSLRGIDFLTEASLVSTSRSPDALNVYKDYTSTDAGAIQTRPGFTSVGNAGGYVYAIHCIGNEILIHSGNKLRKAVGLKGGISSFKDISSEMNTKRSISFIFANKLFILDGANFWVYENETLKKVKDNAYIPTTRIASSPSGGGGSFYQGVNLLSPYRKNAFSSDGESKNYFLDDTDLDDEMPKVYIDGIQKTSGFTYDKAKGVITFENSPEKASDGADNVVIEFKKSVAGYEGRISKCTVACVFDNRVFLSGNDDYPGVVFHSELENAYYFADDRYYDALSDNVKVSSLVASNDKLICIKNDSSYGTKVFWHTPKLDYEMGKIYPVSFTNITLGAKGGTITFADDTLYLSNRGLEGIGINSENAYLYHRSSFVDPKLTNEENYENAVLCVWNNYLLVLIDSQIYLADSMQKTYSDSSFEYEWYLWDGIGVYDEDNVFHKATYIQSIGEELVFGCANGEICIFASSNDNGRAIMSYWCTPQDIFKDLSHVKTVHKRGAVAIIKRIQNGKLKIAVQTNKESFKNVHESVTQGFSFKRVKFGEFNFGTGIKGNICFKIKRNNIWYMQLKFYSDEKDKPFGLYEVNLEYNLSKYHK